jgi:hypothetical protein
VNLMKTIWNKQTGEAAEYESVDAREILANSPDLYTDVDPGGADPVDPDGDGFEGAPQNVANVENEFRREPVGDDPPAKEREEVIIRNPVTDTPRMAPAADGDDEATAKAKADLKAKLDDMTVAELKAYAKTNKVDLGDATRKDDIRAAIDLANGQ